MSNFSFSRTPMSELWLQSQKSHYIKLIREKREINGFKQTLLDIGYSDKEIEQIYIEATMHMDDFDTQPSLKELQTLMTEHPLDCTCIRCNPTNLQNRPPGLPI